MLAIVTLQILEIGWNWYGESAGFFSWDDMVLTVLTLIMQFISSILTIDLSQDFWSHMSSDQISCYLLYIGDYTTQLYIYIGIMINKAITV